VERLYLPHFKINFYVLLTRALYFLHDTQNIQLACVATGRPRPLAHKAGVALGCRHGRIPIVVRPPAPDGKTRKTPTRVVQHEPVLGH